MRRISRGDGLGAAGAVRRLVPRGSCSGWATRGLPLDTEGELDYASETRRSSRGGIEFFSPYQTDNSRPHHGQKRITASDTREIGRSLEGSTPGSAALA
jgi:hypothetical protein